MNKRFKMRGEQLASELTKKLDSNDEKVQIKIKKMEGILKGTTEYERKKKQTEPSLFGSIFNEAINVKRDPKVAPVAIKQIPAKALGQKEMNVNSVPIVPVANRSPAKSTGKGRKEIKSVATDDDAICFFWKNLLFVQKIISDTSRELGLFTRRIDHSNKPGDAVKVTMKGEWNEVSLGRAGQTGGRNQKWYLGKEEVQPKPRKRMKAMNFSLPKVWCKSWLQLMLDRV